MRILQKRKKKLFFVYIKIMAAQLCFCNCSAQGTYATMNIDPIQQQTKYCK
jgi:hypothetical protein